MLAKNALRKQQERGEGEAKEPVRCREHGDIKANKNEERVLEDELGGQESAFSAAEGVYNFVVVVSDDLGGL